MSDDNKHTINILHNGDLYKVIASKQDGNRTLHKAYRFDDCRISWRVRIKLKDIPEVVLDQIIAKLDVL